MSAARRARCARCRRSHRLVKKVMPDGPLCAACHGDAVRRRGTCAVCGRFRLLPGADPAGAPLCCSCAGIDQDYTCARCGTEWRLVRGVCEWCRLSDRLDELLEGTVNLSPLRARLLAVTRPDRIIIWLHRPHVRGLLQGLANGTVPLSHQALDDSRHRIAANHLRGLLVATGLLPERDERLARFDRWVAEKLPEVTQIDEDLIILRQFATWGLRRHLVAQSQAEPLRDAQITNATQKLRVAAGLLTWLHDRGRDLAGCTQADLDEWYTTPPTTHVHATTFVRWAIDNRRCPPLRLPDRRRGNARALNHTQRLDILRRLLNADTGPLRYRVASMLLVLLGQPFTRIASLRLDDIIENDDELGVRLGQGITPIPPPFAEMVSQLLVSRPNLNTATNPTSPWLFPGRTADNHLTPHTLRLRAIRMGIDLTAARTGALRQLVLDCPPSLVADMLGYSYATLDRHARDTGSPWSSYAARRAQPDPATVPPEPVHG